MIKTGKTALSKASQSTPTMPNLVEAQHRLITEAMAANTRIVMPFIRAVYSPWMTATKTGIYYGPNPFMMMTGFSKTDRR